VHVAVGAGNVLAGRMYCDRDLAPASASFVYEGSYLADPDAYALDPALPLGTGTLRTPAGRDLFGAFADSTPDRWGRTLIQRAERARAQAAGSAPRPMDEVDVLLGVRDDLRQGALRYRLSHQVPFLAAGAPAVPGLTDLPELLDIAGRAERGTASQEQLDRLLQAGGSLGGARPKVHVLAAGGRVAIAKFPRATADIWNVMAWEKVALDLARDAGVTVTDSQLISFGDRQVLIVDRFDRRGGDRVGYASARTMLEASGADQRSYLEIAAVIEDRSPAAAADLRELWRRIAFSILISNTDDHLRNHGFLHERGGSWALSPAFDLNPDPRPGPGSGSGFGSGSGSGSGSGPKNLSTAIDYTDTRASVTTLLRVADHFGLDDSSALGVLAEVTQAVAGWRAVAAGHGLPEREIDIMEPAFEHPESERARAMTGASRRFRT